MASHYSAVVEWCEVGEVSDIGLVNKVLGNILPIFPRLVNQALAAAIEELVHDYRLLVCQLEQGINSGLSLHQLWFHLQVVFLRFQKSKVKCCQIPRVPFTPWSFCTSW